MKRLGRGYGSGKGGHTSSRGMKGQRSRSGYTLPRPGFEGGQMPLSRRIPKLKGFSRGYFHKKVKNILINLSSLNKFNDNDKVDVHTLIEKGVIKPVSQTFSIKICGNGKVERKLEIIDIPLSKNAQDKIEAAGGKVISLEHKPKIATN